MNTSNLKTFPGYIIGTDLTGGYRVFKTEFDRYYGIMSRASGGRGVSDEEVAATVLNFPEEPDEADDAVECVTPVDNLFRTWVFHHVTAEQFGKIVVAAKLSLLSAKDAVAMDAEDINLGPYPDDLNYTIAAETKDGKQKIVRMPSTFEQG
jgi:hypothetical protein